MFITNQFKIDVSLADVAATNDTNAATGIAAGGPYNGALTTINVATGATTAIAVGDGVCPVVTTQATLVPFNVISNYYVIDLTGAVAVGGRPHTFKLTHDNLHISNFEYVLDFKLSTAQTDATKDAVATAVPISPMINYNRTQKAFFITIPNNAIAVYTAASNLILQVIFGRQN